MVSTGLLREGVRFGRDSTAETLSYLTIASLEKKIEGLQKGQDGSDRIVLIRFLF